MFMSIIFVHDQHRLLTLAATRGTALLVKAAAEPRAEKAARRDMLVTRISSDSLYNGINRSTSSSSSHHRSAHRSSHRPFSHHTHRIGVFRSLFSRAVWLRFTSKTSSPELIGFAN